MPKVFISHSSTDREFVERELIVVLNRFGIEPWYSKDEIESAGDFERLIRKALTDCDWFLVVLSPHAVTSEWVRAEVAWALENRKNRFIPVLYRTCDPDDIHLKLRLIQHVDYRQNQEAARSKLLNTWKLNYARRPDRPDHISEPFPVDRLIHWVPKQSSIRLGGGTRDYSLVITQEVLMTISEHVSEGLTYDMDRHLKSHRRGFLIGNLYRCPDTERDYVLADEIVTLASAGLGGDLKGFTNDSWAILDKEFGRFRGRLLLGWYESTALLILTPEAVATHEKHFPHPWMKALVVDPTNKAGGIAGWNNWFAAWAFFEEFYELVGPYARASVVAWENYVGMDMKTNAAPILSTHNTASIVPPLKPWQEQRKLKTTGQLIADFFRKRTTGRE